MLKKAACIILFLAATACVERFHFVIDDNAPSLVVEAFLSDKSYSETLMYPSDGRYFTVKLSHTSDVINIRPEMIGNANVELHSDRGDMWEYTESAATDGTYELLLDDFKAEPSVKYKLYIRLPNDQVYESEWEGLPANATPPIGQIGFKETVIEKYAIQANEEVIISVKAIETHISLPENTTGSTLFYRWAFVPHWKFTAQFSSVVLPGHTCWMTTPYYIMHYTVQKDLSGGYKKKLFEIETVRNERIFEKFSALIVQYSMTEPYFNFWSEMRELNQEASIVDKPPFNLATNIHSLDGEKRVSGYFGVVNEQATRWWFTRDDLSYYVQNNYCQNDYGGPVPSECVDCRQYQRAEASNVKPWWWVD
jgi:hypothetical protein